MRNAKPWQNTWVANPGLQSLQLRAMIFKCVITCYYVSLFPLGVSVFLGTCSWIPVKSLKMWGKIVKVRERATIFPSFPIKTHQNACFVVLLYSNPPLIDRALYVFRRNGQVPCDRSETEWRSSPQLAWGIGAESSEGLLFCCCSDSARYLLHYVFSFGCDLIWWYLMWLIVTLCICKYLHISARMWLGLKVVLCGIGFPAGLQPMHNC